MTNSIETRVARGAALLDEREPGWDARVDAGRLDMLSVRDDILGQTWDGAVPEGRNPSSVHYDALFANPVIEYGVRHAFDGTSRRELMLLAAEWRRIIIARRGGAS